MRLLRGVLDRAALVLLILAAGLVPGYLTQYQQQVSGRLEQVRLDLAPFQRIANREHGGSLDALVQHHLASGDATFFAEGDAVRAMLDSERRLEQAVAGLNTTLAGKLGYLVRNPDPDVASATWALYDPTVSVTPGSLAFAGVLGGGMWATLYLLCGGCLALVRRRGRRSA